MLWILSYLSLCCLGYLFLLLTSIKEKDNESVRLLKANKILMVMTMPFALYYLFFRKNNRITAQHESPELKSTTTHELNNQIKITGNQSAIVNPGASIELELIGPIETISNFMEVFKRNPWDKRSLEKLFVENCLTCKNIEEYIDENIDNLTIIPNQDKRKKPDFNFNPEPKFYPYSDILKLFGHDPKEKAELFLHTLSLSQPLPELPEKPFGKDLLGWSLVPINDGATCDMCSDHAKYLYPPDKKPKTPLHLGCRCVATPLCKYLQSHQEKASKLIPLPNRASAS